MSNELVGQVAKSTPTGITRDAARRAQKIRDDIQVAGYRAEGIAALSGHMMQGVRELDDPRVAVSGRNEAVAARLMDFEDIAVDGMKRVLRGVVKDNWDL